MPDEELWASFFQPEIVLDKLGLRTTSDDVVEFGCGYGTFTLPAAHRTSGDVYAIDIEPGMATTTSRKAKAAGLANVHPVVRDSLPREPAWKLKAWAMRCYSISCTQSNRRFCCRGQARAAQAASWASCTGIMTKRRRVGRSWIFAHGRGNAVIGHKTQASNSCRPESWICRRIITAWCSRSRVSFENRHGPHADGDHV